MKIKIIEAGYENFSGMFGTVAFDKGVSIDHVSHVEINLIASLIKVVDAETEAETGNLATEAAAWNKTADVIYYPTMADIEAGREVPPTISPVQEAQKQEVKLYTQEELEEIADKKGIAGLREIADPLGVKGTSIVKLIEGIIATQGEAPAVEQVVKTEEAPAAPEGSDEIEADQE